MKVLKTIGGRVCALFFAFFAIFCHTQAFAASNVWGQWQSVISEEQTDENSLIQSLQNTFSVELWHYSGGYWGNDYVRIKDSQVFDDANELANTINAVMEFQMPLPREIVAVLNDGYNVDIVLSANGIPLNDIFHIEKGFKFQYENNNLIFQAYPKFHFYTEYRYNNFVSGLSKQIPFVVAPYGYNRYAIWTQQGSSVGAADVFFNPADAMDLGAAGAIHPSQIVNNKGHLQTGLNVYVDCKNGTNNWRSSDGLSIGYHTFANAGAVAVHFDYPVTISFYKGSKITETETPDNDCTFTDAPDNQIENPNSNDSTNCGETIRWTEKESHTVNYPCGRHGSHSRSCTHYFTYETTLSTTHSISPKTLKSGYGFGMEVNTAISTELVSHMGECSNWNKNRSPEKTPQPPTQAEVQLGYITSNVLGTQKSSVALERSGNSGNAAKFITAVNPISVMGARTIFTDVTLAGTKENPVMHHFGIYISGGGVNGIAFCKTIPETFIINGSMYDDDGTVS